MGHTENKKGKLISDNGVYRLNKRINTMESRFDENEEVTVSNVNRLSGKCTINRPNRIPIYGVSVDDLD